MARHHKKQKNHQRNFRSQRVQRSSFLIKRLKYLPAIAITIIASILWSQPNLLLWNQGPDVLSYATNVSTSGLLNATNSQRTNNGVAALSMNNQLQSAAQAKANDMVTRDYWSHQTPDGQQPWVFITNAGYQYLSAGENLAYGFMSSSGTVTGWMNSPPHKANLLSATFTEVGFGIANSPNYVGNGPQTIVVAMYGKPQVLGSSPTPTPTPAAQKVQVAKETTPEPEAEKPAAQETESPEDKKVEEPIAVAATDVPPATGSTDVQRIQVLTGGSAMWSATFVVLGVLAIGVLWLIHRGFRFRYWLKASERFLGKHLYLDLAVLAVIYLGFVLLSTSGTIR